VCVLVYYVGVKICIYIYIHGVNILSMC
jgi:hypothetical protein